MAIDDKIINLKDLKVSHDDLDGKVTDLKSDLEHIEDISQVPINGGWVRGSLNASGGESTATTRARSVFIYLKKGETLSILHNSYYWEAYKYTSEKVFISASSSWIQADGTITNNDADYYYRIVIRNPTSSADVIVANIDVGLTITNLLVKSVNKNTSDIINLTQTFSDTIYTDVNGLTWEIGKNINSSGAIGNYLTGALSNMVRANQKYYRYGGFTDSDGVTLTIWVNEYDASGTWLGRAYIDGDYYTLIHSSCVYVRFVFSRTASSGITMTQADIDTYFLLKKLMEIPDIAPSEVQDINNALFGTEFVTPPVVNICGGIEQNFYYQNIIKGFNTKNAYQIGGSVHTTNYNDFARLTPTENTSLTNQGFKINFYPYNSELMMQSNTISYNVVPKTAGSGLTKRILLIGDSLTFNPPLSKHLVDDLLASDTMTVSLIGTLGTAPYLREGRSGWSAHDYVSAQSLGNFTNAFWNPSTGKFDFSYYMSNNGFSGVDYVFINLGTNVGDNTIESIPIDIEEMITSIHSFDANIRVGVWTPPPRALMGNGELIDNDNNLNKVKAIISQFKNRTGERIYLVPVTLNVDPYHDFPYETVNVSLRNSSFQMVVATDRTHPADAGYFKMADVIYNYIKYFGSLDAS